MPDRHFDPHFVPAIAAVLFLVALFAAPLGAQPGKSPSAGYVFPAGARQGETIMVIVGGMNLRGIKMVTVSGEGVEAEVRDQFYGYKSNYGKYLRAVRQLELMKAKGNYPVTEEEMLKLPRTEQARIERLEKDIVRGEKSQLPMFADVRDMTTQEIGALLQDYITKDNVQQNMQIDELLLVELKIGQDAKPGMREIRLSGWNGVSKPLRFEIGLLPEAEEVEPNDTPLDVSDPIIVPFVFNGQVLPGDTDRVRFKARGGQKLLIQVKARALVPFLADAVPGWFQPVVTVFDDKGKKLAYCDDYRFDPDPVVFFEPVNSGTYELEIRDAIFRGREDFVYRITFAEAPFITEYFPLGGQQGAEAEIRVAGWNVGERNIKVDTSPNGPVIRSVSVESDGMMTNPISYAVDTLPERFESEPNDSLADAKAIALPATVNGRIQQNGDVDVYRITGRKNQVIELEVLARRLGSPMDSLLKVRDHSGKVLSWNDDRETLKVGLHTHFADSRLAITLPENGDYYVCVSDIQNHGGKAYAYRLRIAEPEPDFEVFIDPSAKNLAIGQCAPLTATVVRKGGFNGPVTVKLKDPDSPFSIAGNRIPAGVDTIRMTLRAPSKPTRPPAPLDFIATAMVDGKPVHRDAIPADDITQAFIVHHVVPAQESLVQVNWARQQVPLLEYETQLPLHIEPGSKTRVQLKPTHFSDYVKLKLALNAPPEGLTISNVKLRDGICSFDVDASDSLKPGTQNNLIIDATIDRSEEPAKKGKKQSPDETVFSAGCLPALPFIVSANPEKLALSHDRT